MSLSPAEIPEPFSATFTVDGQPITEGSGKIVWVRGHPVITHDANGLDTWRKAIVYSGMAHRPRQPLTGPVAVTLEFRIRVPKDAPKRQVLPMIVRPDWDKLARAVGDALKLGGWVLDDAQITDGHVTKRRAYSGPEGVTITVAETDGLS